MAGRGIVTLLCYYCLSVTCFTVVHFTELAGTLHFDYVSTRQEQRGGVKDPGWKMSETSGWLLKRVDRTGGLDGKKGPPS